jgi:hypothetical protein
MLYYIAFIVLLFGGLFDNLFVSCVDLEYLEKLVKVESECDFGLID